jgi:hypothetical protein
VPARSAPVALEVAKEPLVVCIHGSVVLAGGGVKVAEAHDRQSVTEQFEVGCLRDLVTQAAGDGDIASDEPAAG